MCFLPYVQPFVAEDDTKALIQDEGETSGSLHRSFSASSDREAQKHELKSNVEEPASYGGEKFLSDLKSSKVKA